MAAVETLISGLLEITTTLVSTKDQEDALEDKLDEIKESNTLEVISLACHVSHPNLSDLTSRLSETRTWEIADRTADAERQLSYRHSVESLNITELKHAVISARRRECWLEGYIKHVPRTIFCAKSEGGAGDGVSYTSCVETAQVRQVPLYRLGLRPAQAVMRLVLGQCCVQHDHSCSFPGWKEVDCRTQTWTSVDSVLNALSAPHRCVEIHSLEHPHSTT